MTTFSASQVSIEHFMRIWQAAQSIADVRQAFPFASEQDLRRWATQIRRHRPEMKQLPKAGKEHSARKPIVEEHPAPITDVIEPYILPPGSIFSNCTCPVAANHRGRGGYRIHPDCPLHGDPQWSSSWWALCSQWV